MTRPTPLTTPATLTRRELLDAIDKSPPGPATGAYFDFDGTLIRGHSSWAFCVNRLRHGEWPAEAWHALTSAPPHRVAADLWRARSGVETRAAARLGAAAAACWHGRTEDELAVLSERVFVEEIAPTIDRDMWALVRAHQARGHSVCVATAASHSQVAPLARALGVSELLCTPVPVKGGRVVTDTPPPLCSGTDKLEAVQAHARRRGVELADSYAYCDGYEDLPLLGAVGRPRVVRPKAALSAEAVNRGWPAVLVDGARGSALGRVRATVAAAGAATLALAAAAGAAGAGCEPRAVTAGTKRLGSALVLRAAGVEVVVRDGGGPAPAGPAVYVANHTSPLDPLVLARLVEGDWCAVAKRELGRVPVMGACLRFADTLFVDRDGPPRSAEFLDAAAGRLASGRSVVVLPEGTRSLTPDVGPFRSGAFRIAARAGVPVVPIAIHNATDVMTRKGLTLGPGRIEVTILPPVDTRDWDPAQIRTEADRVRQSLVEALRA
ncbi:HAD-IB family hydrolase [Streptomyces sp. NPDC091272]|uniref:HAD-IB family hydrolase n=1 Tax=Streptomyces sp. NPDC091272 TaxID=3365981 RepID=UPI0037F681D2